MNNMQFNIGFFLYFIGSLSVAVAVFNLFPIPALDGGKLVFLIIEKIKGKPISVKFEQWITVFFFFLLIAMSIYITVRFDIPRFSNYFTSAINR
jgi:regulator of sigma E protease